MPIIEQAIWCYGNIAGENYQLRDQVLAEQVVEPMAAILDNTETDSESQRNIAWCLSNFMKGDDHPPDLQIVAPAVPSLVRTLIRSSMTEILTNILHALTRFTLKAKPFALQTII